MKDESWFRESISVHVELMRDAAVEYASAVLKENHADAALYLASFSCHRGAYEALQGALR